MIDKEQFAIAMGLLSDRFNRSLHPGMAAFYHETLSAELTTEDFLIASRLAMRQSEFWPSPQRLIDYVKPPRDLTLEGAQMFEAVRKLSEYAPQGGTFWRREKVADLGGPALAGFDAIGANEGLKTLEPRYLSVMRKDFIEAFVAASIAERSVKQIEAARAALPKPRIRAIAAPPNTPEPIGAQVQREMQRQLQSKALPEAVA